MRVQGYLDKLLLLKERYAELQFFPLRNFMIDILMVSSHDLANFSRSASKWEVQLSKHVCQEF